MSDQIDAAVGAASNFGQVAAAVEQPRPFILEESRSSFSEPRLIEFFRLYAFFAALLSAGIAGLALLGWVTGKQTLASLNPAFVSMKINTIVCLIGAATGLLLALARHRDAVGHSAAGTLIAGLVAAISLASLSEDVFGWNLGIDQFLIADLPNATGTTAPGRMAPMTSIALMMLAGALLLSSRRANAARTALTLGTISISSLVLTAYFLGAAEINTLGFKATAPAVPTAAALFLLSTGISLGLPGGFEVALLAGSGAGSRILRRMLPIAIILPVVIAKLRLIGESKDFFGTVEFGAASVAISTMFILSAGFVWSAIKLNRAEGLTTAAEGARAAAHYARSLIEASLDPLVMISPQGKITDVNKATEDATGHQRTELIGTDFAGYFTEPEMARAGYKEAFENGSVRDYPLALRHPSGAVMDVIYNANVYRDEKGEIAGIFAAARDVTARRRADQLRDRALRATRMLNVSDSIAIHATEELRLLQDTCRAIIETGRYRLAWVGYAEQNEAKTVRPVAYAGSDGEDYLARANISWSDQDERGRGPTGRAIRTGKAVIARATSFDSNFGPWRKDAAAKGYRSSLAIPLKDNDHVYGALMVYSDEEDFFDIEETRLLTELSADMAYATMALRTKAERDKNAQELQEHRTHLEELIAARTADLAATNTKLEAVNKELETFAYSVSHDLRSPLRAIDGFSTILIEDYGDKLDDEGRRVANIVRDSAQKMGRLIDDILAFSRVGRLEMKNEPIDMDGLARSVLKDLEPVTADRKLTVDVKPLPPAIGDVAMMQRVWQNLLDNAVKFTKTKDNARIEVGATTEGEEITYYVKDNGVGFDMRYVEKLFGVFQRLVGPEEFPGTGIGLAIVKRIVNRHGGRVRAEGKPGEGASFYFTVKTPENARA